MKSADLALRCAAAGLAAAVLAFGGTYQAQSEDAPPITVVDFGAKGDGKTDDTKAFQSAIAEAKQRGEEAVYVPAGQYLLKDTIALDGVSLTGVYFGAWPADNDKLPAIVAGQKEKPVITLQNGTVSGLNISFPHTSKVSYTQYKEAIRIVGNNGRVENVKISSPTSGIKTIGENIRGTHIENVFMTTPHVIGVFLNDNIGETVVKNVEMWTPTQVSGSPFPVSGIGVKMLNNENVILSDVFVFNAAKGFVFEEYSGKGTKAVMTNCSADMTAVGVYVKDEHDIQITGGTYWTHTNGLLVDGGTSTVRVEGAEMRANGDAAFKVNGGKEVTATGCLFRRVMDGREMPTVMITSSARKATVEGCIISARYEDGAASGQTAAVVCYGPEESFVFRSNVINATNKRGLYPENPENTTMSNNIISTF